MRVIRKREIIIEIERTRIVRCRTRVRQFPFCKTCNAPTEFITAAQAATILSENVDDIDKHVAAGTLHGRSVTTGNLQICFNSLLWV